MNTLNNTDLSLKNREWKYFELGKLFKIYTGGDLIISRIKKGNIPIISHSILNNGIAEWTRPIEKQKLFNHNTTINLADRGNFYAYTQKLNFYIGTRVKALEAFFSPCSSEILNFICLVINKQSVKFSYGNNATGGTEKIKILLPINSQNEPDYEFMENYMRAKEQEKINAYKNYISKRISKLENTKKVVPLSEKDWEEFFLNDIFTNIQRGKRLKKNDHKKGKMPYVSSTAMNNGIDGFIGNKEKVRIFSNCLSLANSGSIGSTFYEPFGFVASDHVTMLKNKSFSKSIYLFISTIVSRLGEKYSFNREINDKRIKREKIMLPINDSKEPDYEYMENYMKKLELEKLKTFLKHKNV